MIKSLTYPNYEYCVVDNSTDELYTRQMMEIGGLNVEWYPVNGHSRMRINESYKRLVSKALMDSDVEYVLFLESDIFPPKDIIERLMAHNKPICSAVYYIWDNHEFPCLTSGTLKSSITFIEKEMIDPRTKDRIPYKDEVLVQVPGSQFMPKSWVDGTLKPVPGGSGMGCLLVKREVLQKIKLTYGKYHTDTYFHLDARMLGYKSWVDTSIVVEHENQSWDFSDF